MGRLSLKLLGSPEVYCDGRPLRFRAKKALALLAYLATEGGLHKREKLVALLWPQSDEARGRAALRSALASLRKTLFDADQLPESLHLVAERDSLGLSFGSDVRLDLHALDAPLSTSPAATDTGDIARPGEPGEELRDTLAELQTAAEMYRGEFLEGFSLDDAPDFDHWVDAEREAWRRRAGLVYDRLSRLHLDGGQAEDAASAAARWLEHAPLDEAAHRRLVEARFAVGDRDGALEAYEACREALERELGVEPGPETQALAARIRAEAPAKTRRAACSFGNPKSPWAQPDPPLVGRSEEFGALVAAYHAARGETGGPLAVFVTGEAGIGKTRLASEFLFWARAEGADVLSGAAFEAGEGLPYGPVVGALRGRIESERAPDDLLPDVWLSELGRLLPELLDRYPDLPPPTVDEASAKARLFEAVAKLVGAIAEHSRPEPVVLFVDDLQWADAATLDVLHYGARRWIEEATPVLLVATVRAEALEAEPMLAEWWRGMAHDLPLSTLALGSLSGDDTARLVKELAGLSGDAGPAAGGDAEAFGRWLHGETGGQPLFVTQTLRGLIEEGIITLKPHTGDGDAALLDVSGAARAPKFLSGEMNGRLPKGLREVIMARFSRLGREASTLLTAGAVLGRAANFEVLAGVTGMGEDEALEALDDLMRARLLREDGEGYAFLHDRLRDVAYTEAGSARRRVFHRRAFELLQGGASPAELARHALAGGLPGEAFSHLAAAGDEAMTVFAVDDAIALYEQADALYEAKLR